MYSIRGQYDIDQVKVAVENSRSYSAALRVLGYEPHGKRHYEFTALVKELGINTDHFSRFGPRAAPKATEELLVENSPRRVTAHRLRRALIEIGREVRCAHCKVRDTYNNRPITLEIDHINENPLDNRRENLRFLCPNCHSQITASNNDSRRARCACGANKSRDSTQCHRCHYLAVRSGIIKISSHRDKIEWPEQRELVQMIAESNYSETSRNLGVSVAAIKKRLAKMSQLHPE